MVINLRSYLAKESFAVLFSILLVTQAFQCHSDGFDALTRFLLGNLFRVFLTHSEAGFDGKDCDWRGVEVFESLGEIPWLHS